MISICGYSFMRDVNSCDQIALPSVRKYIDLKKGAFNFIDVKKNNDVMYTLYNNDYDSGTTVVNSDFNHTIFKDFLQADTNDVAKIVVSRYNANEEGWAKIGEYVLSDNYDNKGDVNVLKSILSDNTVTTSSYIYKIEYYKWDNGVLVIDDDMTVTREMEVQLSANFLSDDTDVFPIYMDIEVTATRNQQVS